VKPLDERKEMIEKDHKSISITRQCQLLNVHRSGLYYQPCPETNENLSIIQTMDEQYFKTPFYGVRRLTALLLSQGFVINRKRVRRLMEVIGWQTIYRGPRTSQPDKHHKVYPYLLKGLEINRPNQVWAIDITYVPMRKGYMYLCAVIDLHTRFVVNWSVSNSMTAEWCKQVVDEAINSHGKPEILNSDQGSQFTSELFTQFVSDHGILVSMDGKGRAIDNIFIERLWRSVKYEYVYLNISNDGVELYAGLKKYFEFYNNERFHQSLNYQAPGKVYKSIAA
jgi:putative transposase